MMACSNKSLVGDDAAGQDLKSDQREERKIMEKEGQLFIAAK